MPRGGRVSHGVGAAVPAGAGAFHDEAADGFDREDFGRGGAGVVVDEFVADGAVDVVGAVGKGDLGGADEKRDVVGPYLDDLELGARHAQQVHDHRSSRAS